MKILSLPILALLFTFNISHAQQGKIEMHGKESSQNIPLFYGKILEIKSAMGYKYLKIDEKGEKLWIAIADAPVSIGEKIGFDKQTLMENFSSKSLNKTFDKIYFASNVSLTQKANKPQSMKDLLGISTQAKQHTPIDGNTMAKVTMKPFVKKEIYTVEEVYLWRKNLKDQMITVAGEISKISRNIMKRDWVHIGDGTGNQTNKNNDLIFTAVDTVVKVGDKIHAKGKVTIDKDFGYGYFYPVIIENAKFEGN